MNPAYYQFFDLFRLNRYLLWMLIAPAILSLLGFAHGLHSVQQLSSLAVDTPLISLPAELQQTLATDGLLRLSQISLTLWVLTFFFACWLYFAFRNLVALFEQVEQTSKQSALMFGRLMIGILFALRMMLRLWRTSLHDQHRAQARIWLVPIWWAILIAANVCKICAVVVLQRATSVGEWSTGYQWMLAAYCLYFPLYILTWRLAQQLARFQYAHWQYPISDSTRQNAASPTPVVQS